MTEVREAAARPGALAEKALNYVETIKEIARKSKGPSFTVDAWDELAKMVATDEFVRVGRFKEVMDWDQCVELMDQWARIAEFSSDVRRIKEVGSLVFLELHERNSMRGDTVEVDTMTVFEFNGEEKFSRLDFYQ